MTLSTNACAGNGNDDDHLNSALIFNEVLTMASGPNIDGTPTAKPNETRLAYLSLSLSQVHAYDDDDATM